MSIHAQHKLTSLARRGIALLGACMVSLGAHAAKPIIHDAE